jgi:thiamine kinase-like enzyme
MNNDQLHTICASLDLGRPISLPIKVQGGLLHLMWRVDTEKGSYAIKQLSKNINLTVKIRKEYELSEKIAQQFAIHGIPSISGIEKEGKFLVNSDGDTFIIYPWANAKILGKDAVNVFHVVKIGTLLAKMHLLNLSVPEIESPQYDIHSNEEIITLIEKSRKMASPFANKLQQSQPMLIKLNDRYQQAITLFRHIFVVSHADLDQKNVLWDKNDNPILIDWESVRALNPTYEILIAALDWSGATNGELNTELFVSMIDAYKKAGGTIDQVTLNANFYGIPGNGISWMIYNIRRSLKTEDTTAEEKALGIEQVNQVIKSMTYLESKIEHLKMLMRKLDA